MKDCDYLYGDILFLTQQNEVKRLDVYYDENVPHLGGGYTRDDILCISGQHIDWEAVDDYDVSIDAFTLPSWAWR